MIFKLKFLLPLRVVPSLQSLLKQIIVLLTGGMPSSFVGPQRIRLLCLNYFFSKYTPKEFVAANPAVGTKASTHPSRQYTLRAIVFNRNYVCGCGLKGAHACTDGAHPTPRITPLAKKIICDIFCLLLSISPDKSAPPAAGVQSHA
jgi:hypothetical protein